MTRRRGALLAAALLAAACGDGSTGGGAGGADGGGRGGGAGAGGAGGAGSGGGGAGGGPTGDGNDSFAEAIELGLGAGPVDQELEPLTSDVDYFAFDAAAGDAVLVTTTAKPAEFPFGEAWADLVVTLYDEAGVQLAQNDDPVPRTTQNPQLVTVLPATGRYYLEVAEYCLTWSGGPLGVGCNDQVENPGYSIAVGLLDGALPAFVEEAEPNGAPAAANAWAFEPADAAGNYLSTLAWGELDAAGGVDVYAFTPPSGVALAVGKPVAYVGRFNVELAFVPSGPAGSGAPSDVGLVQLLDAATLAPIAELDVDLASDPTYGAQLAVPLLADGAATYYVVVAAPPGAGGPGHFYFVQGSVGAGNPVESDPASDTGLDGNDDPATADVLPSLLNGDGSSSRYVEGNLPAGDVDHYAIPNDGTQVAVLCTGAAIGSGVTLRATLVDAAGVPIDPAASADELVAAGGASFAGVPTAGAGATFFLRVEPVGQSPTLPSDFYRCGVRVH